MADTKISALTETTAPLKSDVIPVVNGGSTKKMQLQYAAPAIWARVFHNTTQSINNATDTALAFNSERADTDTMHDTVTNNSRLTCKTAGVFHIEANVDFASNTTGFRAAFLRLNGTTTIASNVVAPVNGLATRMSLSTLYSLAVNDYIEVMVHQTSGGALNAGNLANAVPEFSMIRLGF